MRGGRDEGPLLPDRRGDTVEHAVERRRQGLELVALGRHREPPVDVAGADPASLGGDHGDRPHRPARQPPAAGERHDDGQQTGEEQGASQPIQGGGDQGEVAAGDGAQAALSGCRVRRIGRRSDRNVGDGRAARAASGHHETRRGPRGGVGDPALSVDEDHEHPGRPRRVALLETGLAVVLGGGDRRHRPGLESLVERRSQGAAHLEPDDRAHQADGHDHRGAVGERQANPDRHARAGSDASGVPAARRRT